MNKTHKNALVVEGGAMRGIFATGVLDAFIKEKYYPFDLCIGVSAGSTNTAAYLAGMYGRNYRVYTEYSTRPEFINWKKFLFGHHLVDLDWLWEITIREIRLDLKKIISSASEFLVGLTDVLTGKSVYMKPTENNLEEIIKASSAIPVFYRKFINIDGTPYADGGIADPIPVMEAYRRGSKNITVLRSRPYSKTLEVEKKNYLMKMFLRKYPALTKTIMERPKVYNDSIDFLRSKHHDIVINEINPPEDFKTGRLTTDINTLKEDYTRGFNSGIEFMKKWKSSTE